MKVPDKNYLRSALIIILIFIITRLIIFSSIIFIKDTPLSPDSRSFKRVSSNSAIILPYNFKKLMLWADSDIERKVKISLNGNEQETILIGRKEELHVIELRNPANGINRLEFTAGCGDGESEELVSWRLWDIRTDTYPGTSILKEHNMMYSQSIKTQGISGSEVPLSGRSIKSLLLNGLSKWDANQYAGIIYNGYRYDGDNTIRQNIVFPYLFPLTAGILTDIGGINAVWAGVAVNNLSFLVSLFFIYYLSCQVIRDRIFQFMPVILLCVHPFSIFLVSAYSEGLFILILSSCMYFLYKKKYAAFALLGGALSAVRVVGAVTPLLLIFDYYIVSKNKVTIKSLFMVGAMTLISFWGISSFMLYGSFRFNEPFAMFLNQNAWTPGSIRLDYCVKHFIEPFVNIRKFMEPEIMGMGLAVVIVVYCAGFIILRKNNIHRLEYLMAVFSIVLIGVPVVFYNKAYDIHMAMGRYTLPSYPVFMLLSKNANLNKIPYFLVWILFSVFILIIMTMRFSWGYTPY